MTKHTDCDAKGLHDRLRLKFVAKATNKVSCGIPKNSQYVSDCDHLGETNFLERYLNNEVYIAIKGRVRFGKDESENFTAFFRDRGPLSVRCHDGSAGLDAKPLCFRFIGSNENVTAHLRGGDCDEQEGMFVGIIHALKGGQEVVIRRRLAIWLRLGDFRRRSVTDPLYVSARDGLFVTLPAPLDRELVVVEGALAGLHSQRDNQMVQARAQMMDDFPGENGESSRGKNFACNAEYILSKIILEVAHDAISTRILADEGVDFIFEINDVLAGPLKF